MEAGLRLTRKEIHLGGKPGLKREGKLGRQEKEWSSVNFLIKAQMFNGKCAYKGGGGGPFPPIHSWSPAAGDDVQDRL